MECVLVDVKVWVVFVVFYSIVVYKISIFDNEVFIFLFFFFYYS